MVQISILLSYPPVSRMTSFVSALTTINHCSVPLNEFSDASVRCNRNGWIFFSYILTTKTSSLFIRLWTPCNLSYWSSYIGDKEFGYGLITFYYPLKLRKTQKIEETSFKMLHIFCSCFFPHLFTVSNNAFLYN